MKLAGLVLAGGAGSRMGGSTLKPLIEVGGKTLAGHAIERLEPHSSPVLISANDAVAFEGFGLPVLGDRRPGRLGPLAGLEAAALYLTEQAPATTHLVCLPGDTPFLPPEVVPRLAHRAGNRVRVAASAGRLHPTVAVWPLAALSSLQAELDSPDGARSMRTVLEHVGFEAVEFAPDPTAPESDAFFNVNTPCDLETAQGHLNSRPSSS